MEKEQPRFDREEPLDSQVARLVEVLRPTPPRDPSAAARGRSRFLAELDVPFSSAPANLIQRIFQKVSKDRMEKTNMNTRQKRFAFSTLALILMIGVLLFGGAGITAAVAQEALPGDALYSVKTGIEQTRLSLARDAGNRAQLKMDYAERRLREIEALVVEGRYNNLDAAAQQFEVEIYGALAELETISAGDPSRAAQLAEQITAALSRYAQSLSVIAAKVPELARPGLNRAVQAAQIGSQLRQAGPENEFMGVVEQIGPEAWTVSGIQVAIGAGTEIKGSIRIGDVVKIHLSAGPSGSRLAREIELAGIDELKGTNDNAVDATDDNSNTANDNSTNANGDNSNSANENDSIANDNSANGNGSANDNSASDSNDNGNSANDNDANDNSGANDNNADDNDANDNGDDKGKNDDRSGANENNANGTNDDAGNSANDNSGDDNGSNNNGDDNGSAGNVNGDDNGSNDNGNDDDRGGSNDNGGDDHGSNDNEEDPGGNNNGSDDSGGDDGGDDNGNGDY